MRRAHGLRAAATRDVCILCATRQLAIRTVSAPQQRQLNSSSRSPQSAEGIIYKDASHPAQPVSQAARMRQLLAASAAYTPPAKQSGGYPAPAHRMRPLGQHLPQQPSAQAQRQPLPERRVASRVSAFDTSSRNQSRDRFAIGRRESNNERLIIPRAPPQSRYMVNMDSRPKVNTPAFGSKHLKRRIEPQSEQVHLEPKETKPPPVRRTIPQRNKLDQDEIDKLLGSAATNRPSKPFRPLTSNSNVQKKCWHCGSTGHESISCPVKPTLRESKTEQQAVQQPPQRTTSYQPSKFQHSEPKNQQPLDSLTDAADEWARRTKGKFEAEQPSRILQEEDKWGRRTDKDRRRNRFELDEPMEVRNRYEEPERRRGGNKGRSRQWEAEEEDDRPFVNKQDRKRLRAEAKKAAQLAKSEPIPISLPEYISVANLAGALRLRVEDFVLKLEQLGFEEVQNDHILNAEHAGLIAQEYNYEPIFQAEEDDGDLYPAPALEPEAYAQLPVRPPVVTIMGHVDHGKTTILDYMRSTSVVASEFGGITQHIGAFSVPLANGKKITFLDTPGHSAFETMRARGANVTDIVVLVVAADDSVMPQTVEAIKHAQAANVPMIVAINKIDKQQADPDAVKSDLGRHGIEIEDFGGDVQTVCVSGKTGQGIPDLEEAISTLSEMLDHRADPEAVVEGWVLEGTTKKSGRVATVLVRSGTLRQGTTIVAGKTWAKVRSLRNEAGVAVKEVGPGMAVEIDGWRDQPIAGDEVLQAVDEQHATSVSGLRTEKVEREQMARDMEAVNEARRVEAERREAKETAEKAAASGEEVADPTKSTGPEVVSFIIKGDVSGSVEAVIDSVSALGNGEVSSRILRHGVGPPSEFDVTHAADAQGHIVNFNTTIPNHVAKLAQEKGVRILDSNIIYRVVENVKELLSEKLKPRVTQKVTGEAEVAALFEINMGKRKTMKVAGSKVRNGVVDKSAKARVLRGDEIIHVGSISSIKNVKKEVDQMRKDTECGISLEDFDDFKIGDRIQCFEEKLEKRSL